jgi:hypothetical protein
MKNKMIKLTSLKEGADIYINIDKIDSFHREKLKDSQKEHTVVFTSKIVGTNHGSTSAKYHVRETLNGIMDLIQAATPIT